LTKFEKDGVTDGLYGYATLEHICGQEAT